MLEKKKLNLGCGNIIEDPKEWINHDLICHREEIDIDFDLNEKDWWREFIIGIWRRTNVVIIDPKNLQEIEEIKAWDVLEHLNDPINFMNNCWQLLKKDGVLNLKVCGWKNPNFWVDITHKKAYDIRSFDYFVFDTPISKEYNYYTDKKWKYLDGYPVYDRHKNIIVKMTPIK